MSRFLRRDDGFSLVELLTVMIIIAVVVAVGIPAFIGFQNRARTTEAKAELRTILNPVKMHHYEGGNFTDIESSIRSIEPSARIDNTAVAGVMLQASSDGAVCMWRVAAGQAYGIWEPQDPYVAPTLYGVLDEIPDTCPTQAEAFDLGFTRSSW